jgi:hypothetical protein
METILNHKIIEIFFVLESNLTFLINLQFQFVIILMIFKGLSAILILKNILKLIMDRFNFKFLLVRV